MKSVYTQESSLVTSLMKMCPGDKNTASTNCSPNDMSTYFLTQKNRFYTSRLTTTDIFAEQTADTDKK